MATMAGAHCAQVPSIPPLKTFCQNLRLPFGDSFPSQCNQQVFESSREQLHGQTEAIVQQVCYLVAALSDLHKEVDQTLHLAFLIGDLNPATSLFICRLVMKSMQDDMSQLDVSKITVISRDDYGQQLQPGELNYERAWDWENPKFLQNFNLVVVFASSMNLLFMEECLRRQDMAKTCALLAITPAATPARLCKILKTDFLAQPYWGSALRSEANHLHPEGTWEFSAIKPRQKEETLNYLNSFVKCYVERCFAQKTDASGKQLSQRFHEWSSSFQATRLSYHD
ncbi:hypothetical protein DFS34DRAFT_81581 [Phlyctochytrium arcticum]|nr:hypothetical protein DFS34DRAFT_81581 [Phlyctochytrium arcticum]